MNKTITITHHHPIENEISRAMKSMGLTPRETEVLEWLAKGKTNSEIGIILNISHRTASKHLERIYAKLGVESRTAAVILLLERIQEFRSLSSFNPSQSLSPHTTQPQMATSHSV